MENSRRSFLKGLGLAGTVVVLPGPLKSIATRFGLPASAVVQALNLKHSTAAIRATWTPVAAMTARVVQARAWLMASGAAASAILKSFIKRHDCLPKWYDPLLQPSLRSILNDSVR